jgi:hypothetical protein
MKLHRLAFAIFAMGLGSSITAGCTLDSGDGNPDPGQYWVWSCPEGGTPLDASTPIDYVASGTCGAGGPFSLSVDGCEMFGSWSVLGLSNVQTVQYASSPGLGGWSISATGTGVTEAGVVEAGIADGGASDGGASWTCTARAAKAGDLTFTCSNATTSATTCRSTLTPVSGS